MGLCLKSLEVTEERASSPLSPKTVYLSVERKQEVSRLLVLSS